jgi:hypothetical protein
MAFATPAFDGNPIFGVAVKIKQVQNPSISQINAFFGVNGQFSLFGGQRGRFFTVEGMLVGSDIGALNSAEQIFMSYDDGVARNLQDTRGRVWPSVVFRGDFQAGDIVFLAGGSGFGMPYKALFHGLL